MTREIEELLEAFEQLPAEDKRKLCLEILRRRVSVSFRFELLDSGPFDSGPLRDEEIAVASAPLFAHLDEY